MMRKTMPVAKAQVLAEESGIQELVDAVLQAIDQGWEVVEFVETEDGGNVTVEPHTGVMVAWFLPEYLADRLQVQGGEQDLHITLCYLGDLADLTVEQQRQLVGIVSEAVEGQEALYGAINGTSTFPAMEGKDQYPWYAAVDIPGLAQLREKLVAKLEDAGIPVVGWPEYTPHVTLAYLDNGTEPPALALPAVSVCIEDVTVAIAGSRRELSLGSMDWDARDEWFRDNYPDEWDAWGQGTAFVPFIKSVVEAEKRFTLGPWYIPDLEDAHGEWTDADELQQALWDYVDAGYRGIHLQHMPDTVAGRWVEIMTLPWPMEVPVTDPNGLVVAHSYPAGTVMMGVIWDPWAWDLVKSGKITGYSIGGNAGRTDEQPPGDQHHHIETDDAE